jgi:hypothetical protein
MHIVAGRYPAWVENQNGVVQLQFSYNREARVGFLTPAVLARLRAWIPSSILSLQHQKENLSTTYV